ncbi:asparagine synthetase domain-containing protein 1 isoform X3 [Orussus abietinus]|uniref:asparagine synthetase domain-containing protein 1 isoform X3 n=1 Tax=Orussus abietinus TaxID=222816 RepID=UPI000C715D32|nr:asparagine synthetase domain-containing protein 1 isoform X3 [Orussus abietinus]
MCGIFCQICHHESDTVSTAECNSGEAEWNWYRDKIASRGPDGFAERFDSLPNDWHAHFAASVLWMQGDKCLIQPCIDSTGNVLLWNGDIFSGNLASDNTCDTITVLNNFELSDNISQILKDVEGPYSFVYFQRHKNLLYFGRDCIGRHSLLIKLNLERNFIMLTSAASKNVNEPEAADIQYLEDISYYESIEEAMTNLLENNDVLQRVEHLLELLKKSVEVRVNKKPHYCKDCIKTVLSGKSIECPHTKVGVLFSGGLDSAILAILANEFIPENECIDLINVAFEKAVIKNGQSSNTLQYDVPDRKTGRQTYNELLQICPNREWNLIEINVTQSELQMYRSSRISDLVYPLRTVLDESLGCAVWFASRGKGQCYTSNESYESPCRVLLLGMGADELFGGYMRHRTTLKHKGWAALTRELSHELDRISERNLGRDDRIVSDHGRQSRLPYLDERVVRYVKRLKPWERCFPTDRMPPGLGDKLLLRLVARRLGLQSTANFPKRAFQFGSRIANSKENAKDISDRL